MPLVDAGQPYDASGSSRQPDKPCSPEEWEEFRKRMHLGNARVKR